jgi:iron-sulfur cluster assembly protein
METVQIAEPRKKRALPPLLTVTETAAARLRTMYAKSEEKRLLRIGVKATGCSGMSYDMSWAEEPAPTDEVVTSGDVTVLVDRKASLFLIGTTMDYETKGLTAGFTFVNPNEKDRCGCGESFRV